MTKYIYLEPTHKIFARFDNYEISPCLVVDISETGEIIYEACDSDNPDIAIWCVYGHLKTGGCECISDHQTYEEAKEYMRTLPKISQVLIPFYGFESSSTDYINIEVILFRLFIKLHQLTNENAKNME